MTVAVLILLALLAVAGGVFALLPLRAQASTLRVKTEREELQDELGAVLRQITDLERARAEGEMDSGDFERLKLEDETRAAGLLARIEALPEAPPKTSAVQPSRPALPLALGWLVGLSIVFAGLSALAVPALQRLALPAGEAAYYDSSERLLSLEATLNEQAKSGKPKVADLLEYAGIAWEMQDWERAARGYSAVLSQDRGNLKAISRYGQLLFFGGENDSALKLLEPAAQLGDTEAMLTLGNLRFSRGDAAGALTVWQQYQKVMGDKAEPRVVQLIAAARKRLQPASAGEASFAKNCAACHGASGEGISGTAPSLIASSRARDAAFVRRQIQKGSANQKMPAFPQITGAELEALVKHVTDLKK